MDDPYRHSVEAYEVLHAARRKDYRGEAAAALDRIRRHRPDARTILDVACGTGLMLPEVVEGGARSAEAPAGRER